VFHGRDLPTLRAVRLRHRVLIPLLVLVLPALGAASAQAACPGASTSPRTLAQARGATLCLLNAERARHGLHPLRLDHRLRSAADRYSEEMVRDGFFAHIAPDGSTLPQRLAAAGYSDWQRIGENIAWGSGRRATPASIFSTWMHSPGHRANILDGAYREIGVGVARGTPTGTHGARAAVYTTDFAEAH
jgi:uncharacterized protein YkwD